MTRLADMRARLEMLTSKKWVGAKPFAVVGTVIHAPGNSHGNADRVLGKMYNDKDADFVVHAPEDMCTLLDAADFVVGGKPIRYVVTQLDAVSQELETAGDHGGAQMLSRLAVTLERLG